MQITPTKISDVYIITPRIFQDERGYFFESYNKQKLDLEHISYTFVQDNESKSSYGVIRGLHFQKPPHAQTKLLRVVHGAILDVAVDIRTNSPTFGKYVSVELTAENHKQLLIPAGFAHGFSVLSETATVQYKCTDYYHPETEGGLIYNDPTINIDWKIPTENAIVSSKDTQQPKLADINSPF
ncbi:MAG: dTDP-4-dehydrorhamnose 3,5-epimerase [Bacteroidales bacterium]|jgi:dTDP-4-dehydrorhamnose 3,5-epimerase|nr:dTDP-4-dehydrorhamnose 3,5-epimerase [Bacteroidales bacterium]